MVVNKTEITLFNIIQPGACARCLAGGCALQLPRMTAEVHLVGVRQDELEMQVRYMDWAVDMVHCCVVLGNPSLQHVAEGHLAEIQQDKEEIVVLYQDCEAGSQCLRLCLDRLVRGMDSQVGVPFQHFG